MDDINLLQMYKNKEYKKFIVNYLMLKGFEIEDLKLYIVSKKTDINNYEYDYAIIRGFDCHFIINGKKPLTIKSHKLHKCFKKLLKNGDKYLFNPHTKYINKEIINFL